jgi:hypothetical protein
VNGPQHYREAERLIAQAQHYTYGDGSGEAWGREYGASLLAEANAHATLALAAATALAQTSEMSAPDANEWTMATSASAAAIEFARADMERNAAVTS